MIHFESSAQKWKFIIQKRINCERELNGEALGCKDLVNLVKVVLIMNIVTESSPCFEKLVMEFIENISPECNIERRQEYNKVYVRGKCVGFSPFVINEHLRISKSKDLKKFPYTR